MSLIAQWTQEAANQGHRSVPATPDSLIFINSLMPRGTYMHQWYNHHWFRWWLVANQAKWKHFSGYWPFVQGIHRSPVNSLHNGQWHWALMFSLICAWINDWVKNGETGILRRHRAHYDVTVMIQRTRWQGSFCERAQPMKDYVTL